MDSLRAGAYGRVMWTLRELGPTKLWPAEQGCVREAADALLFCADRGMEPAALDAIAGVIVLGEVLIHAGRWTPERVRRLIDDIWACGPWEPLEMPIAA
jgi:hypothetical protein